MIAVTNTVKQAYNKSTIQVDKIVVNGTEYRINNVDYQDDCYDEGNVFGSVIAKILEFEIENCIDLEKKEIEYYTGIYINNNINWIYLGNFIIQNIEPNEITNINKVTAMDYMLKTNMPYTSSLNYDGGNVTILDVIQEACQISGLTLATTDFINNDFIVDSNQFTEDTLVRQVVKAVAQISGTFAKIRSDNKLYFVQLNGIEINDLNVSDINNMTVMDINQTIVTKNEYSDLIIKRNTHPINVVTLGMSQVEGENVTLRDEDSIAEDGENVIVINDNPFAYTQNKRQQLIQPLFNKIKGFSYKSYELKGQSKPFLETGDPILLMDKNGMISPTFIFRFNFKSPNGLESEMSAPSLTKATVNYQNTPDALDIAKRTEIIVNKKIQEIKETVKDYSDETDQKIAEVTLTTDGLTSQVNELKEEVDNIEVQTDVYTKTETNSLISQSATQVKTEVSTQISTAKTEAINSANSSTDNKLRNYSTTTQMNSAISQTASSIRTEVNKKVDSSDFGTLIEQNYSHVRIAWNNISQYIQFENAQLNIYDGSNYKLLSLNRYGMYLYSSGTKFGTMSLSTWEGSSYKRGLMFNLDMEGYYEGWGRKTSSSSSSYTVALVYSRANGAYTEEGLHMGADLYTHGNAVYFDTNKYVRTVGYSNAAAIRVTSGSFYIERSNGGDILKFDWDGRLEVHSEMTMYANLQLNGNSVWLDGNTIHVSSDKRLKKNIKPVNVSALDKISQLKVKEFDWKANNEHVNAGFIAQELQEIFPDLVKENPTKKEIDGKKINSLAISYEGLIPYLVKAIQELKSIIDKEKENGR